MRSTPRFRLTHGGPAPARQALRAPAGHPSPALRTRDNANSWEPIFAGGARQGEAMSLVASALADQDIEDLAAYFSAIEIRVVKIPD